MDYRLRCRLPTMHFVSASVTLLPAWMFTPRELVSRSQPVRWEFVREGIYRGFERKRGVKLDFYVSAPRTCSLKGDLCFSARTQWETFTRSERIKGTRLDPTIHPRMWAAAIDVLHLLSQEDKTTSTADRSTAGSTFAFVVNIKYVNVGLFYQELRFRRIASRLITNEYKCALKIAVKKKKKKSTLKKRRMNSP